MDQEVRIQGAAFGDRGSDAGFAVEEIRGARSGDRAGLNQPGSHTHAGGCMAAVGTVQAGAASEGAVQPVVAGRVSRNRESGIGGDPAPRALRRLSSVSLSGGS